MSQERTHTDNPSWMAQPLRRLTTWIVAHPGATLTFTLAIALVSLLVTATGLKFKLSRLDLLNPKSEYNQRWLAYLKEFGDRDDAVVVVQGEQTKDVLLAIDDVASELKRSGQPFELVLSEWDLSSFRSKGLQYVPPEALARLQASLEPLRALRRASSSDPDPATALRALNDQLERAGRLPEPQVVAIEQQYLRLFAALAEATNESRGFDPSSLVGLNGLDEALEGFKSHHLLMNDGQTGFILLRLRDQPGEATRGAAAIQRLREVIEQTRPKHAGVQIGVTGMPILEYDEMTASQADMARSTWLSFVCVLAFFWASFGSFRHTLLSNATLAIGMAWSFGYLTLVIGHLNILSVAFAAILIGIGIDFSIHYVSHYLNYRARGMASDRALIETATYVGPGVITGAVTTALAFFTAAFTEFVGIVELGVIAGGGILLCLLATVIALPAMIQLADRNATGARPVNDILNISGWLLPAKWFPRATMLAAVVATVLLCSGLKDLRYDHNLLHLQPNHLESVEIEREVLGSKDQSFWCALAMADDPQHALALKAQFESLDTVARVEEVASLFPLVDDVSRQSIVRISGALASLPVTSDALPLPDVAGLQHEAQRAQALLMRQGRQATAARLAALDRRLSAATQTVEQQREAFAELLPKLRSLQALNDPEPPRLGDMPLSVSERYVGRSGKFLLRIYAKGHIWDMAALSRFVADVESVDPKVTGHPIQTFYASRHMQKSYLEATLYSLICVVGTLLLDYRSIRHTLLAMLPLVLGVLQMLGIMGLCGIPFNPANMIALPLILGMGVEDGVHLVHEYRRQKGRFQLGNSTAMAVMLTSATTISGFACMIIARHQGLRSLGQILTFGMTTCMVVSLYSLPALLRWMTRDREDLPEEADDVLPGTVDALPAVIETSDEPDLEEDRPRPVIRPTRRLVAAMSLMQDERAA